MIAANTTYIYICSVGMEKSLCPGDVTMATLICNIHAQHNNFCRKNLWVRTSETRLALPLCSMLMYGCATKSSWLQAR